jgi:ubiquinone biosynthesis protein COQ9
MIGIMKLKGILVIYFSTFLTWIKDESSSLDKTMTVLDDYLKGTENVLKLFKK